MAAACDTAGQTYHAGWTFIARYTQHVISLLLEVTTVGAYQCMHLEEYDHQVEAKDRLIDELRKGEQRATPVATLHQEAQQGVEQRPIVDILILKEKTHSLDSTRAQLHHTNDKLAST
jgi:hypothetical protein